MVGGSKFKSELDCSISKETPRGTLAEDPGSTRPELHFPAAQLTAAGADRSGFGRFVQPPELKPFNIDCFFDRIMWEVMGRRPIGPDHPGNGPWTTILREFAPHRVAGEGVQTL